MSDQPNSFSSPGVPFEGSDSEQALWQDLSTLPAQAPGPALRSRFYEALSEASRPSLAQRLVARFGNAGLWLPAAACLVVGIALGLVLRQMGPLPTDAATDAGASPKLAALEARVTELNRQLILDQLDADATSTRLRGVLAASDGGIQDPQLSSALLRLAYADNSASVRGAAIDALAPKMAEAEVGDALMTLLVSAESPLVQLSLVNIVLRHGTGDQVSQLLQLATDKRLIPELIPYVESSVERSEI